MRGIEGNKERKVVEVRGNDRMEVEKVMGNQGEAIRGNERRGSLERRSMGREGRLWREGIGSRRSVIFRVS